MHDQGNAGFFTDLSYNGKIQPWLLYIKTMRCAKGNGQAVHSSALHKLLSQSRIRINVVLPGILIDICHMPKFCFHRYSHTVGSFNNLCRLHEILLKRPGRRVIHNRSKPCPYCLHAPFEGASVVQMHCHRHRGTPCIVQHQRGNLI